jgi:hypothetical protein
MALSEVSMSYQDTVYIKDLEERVEELEQAIERALEVMAFDVDAEARKILEEVN